MRKLALLFFATVIALAAVSPRALAQHTSDTEKRAMARALFTEGVKLQDNGSYAEALKRFEGAQKFFGAPTHLLRIAECQALLGKLVDSAETYQLLARSTLPDGSPPAFLQAQQQGAAELPGVQSRIPTIKIDISPQPSTLQNLQIAMNGNPMAVDLVGVPRPVDPGTYKITASASGYRQTQSLDVMIKEKDAKAVTVVLQPGGGMPPPVVIPPGGAAPPPSNGSQPPPAYKEGQVTSNDKRSGSTSLLLGGRIGAVVPGGDIGGSAAAGASTKTSDYAGAGAGFGLEGGIRFAKFMYVGLLAEYSALGEGGQPPRSTNGSNLTTTASSTYFGGEVGFISNFDKLGFYGELNLGARSLSHKIKNDSILSGSYTASLSGLDYGFAAGVIIPAQHFRLIPKLGVTFGSFTKASTSCDGYSDPACGQSATITDTATHSFIFAGLGILYDIPLSKPAPDPPAISAN